MWIAESLREEAERWRALGDPVRWRIVRLLAQRPYSVTAICEELDTYQSLVSGHLATLRRAGLVEAERRGYFNVYKLNGHEVKRLIDSLDALAGSTKL